jgi:uncharacterized protein (TIGR03437 family)
MMINSFCILFAAVASAAYGSDFTTYIADENQYQVAAIGADSAGDTYVTGSRLTQVSEGPPPDTLFVTKLDASGDLVFTKTFPGAGQAIAADSSGNIWVGGVAPQNFPVFNPLLATYLADVPNGFLMKLAPDGTVLYSSYFYGPVNGLAVDPGGNVYLTGYTNYSGFPASTGLLDSMVEEFEIAGAFIAKLDPSGSRILYSALIAGTNVDCTGDCAELQNVTSGVSIALDKAGDAFVAGNSTTTDLPITPGGIAGYGAFAAAINPAGNKLIYLTYVGSPAGEVSALGPAETITASAIAVDSMGDAYLTGSTNDPKFPATTGAYQTTLTVGSNAYAVKLNPSGAAVWATYLGSPASDSANGIALDAAGDVWLVGSPVASPYAKVTPAVDFLEEFSPDGSKLLSQTEFAGGTEGQAVTIDPAGVLHVSGVNGLVWTITPGVPYAPRIFGIMNAAGSQVSGRVAPGEIVSIFGAGLGPSLGASPTLVNGRFPTNVDGVQVLLNGSPIPLIYVSASQINAEIPAPISLGADDTACIQVINGSSTLPSFRVEVDTTIFGVFQNADGSISAIDQDGSVNSASHPAQPGTVVSIWATGMNNPRATIDGAVTIAANNWCGSCQFSVGTVTETAAYAGAAPGLIDGAMQINLTVPTEPGDTQLQVFFNGQAYGFIYVSE